MRTNARFILVGALLVLGIANDVSAGSITPELKETLAGVAPDATAPVIVTLSDQVDLKAFQGREERGLLRARLVRALRAKAGLTQAPLLALLNARGRRASGPSGSTTASPSPRAPPSSDLAERTTSPPSASTPLSACPR